MIPSRGKHREFAQVSTQQSHRSSATHAERRSRYRPIPLFSSSFSLLSFLLSPFRLFGISLSLSLPFRLSYLSAPRSSHSLCLFRVFAVECHNFCESLRFGRRWVERRGRRIRIKRTDCRKLVENPDEIREPPRRRAASLPLAYPSVVVRSAPRCLLLFLFSPPAAARPVSLLRARPSSFTGFSQFYYRALPSRLTM